MEKPQDVWRLSTVGFRRFCIELYNSISAIASHVLDDGGELANREQIGSAAAEQGGRTVNGGSTWLRAGNGAITPKSHKTFVLASSAR